LVLLSGKYNNSGWKAGYVSVDICQQKLKGALNNFADFQNRNYYKTINFFCFNYILVKIHTSEIILIRIFVPDFRK